jgi:hypothetical protein
MSYATGHNAFTSQYLLNIYIFIYLLRILQIMYNKCVWKKVNTPLVSHTPHPISLWSTSVSPAHLRLGFDGSLFLYSFSYENPLRTSFLSHHPWLDHSNYTWQRVQVTNLLIVQFSPPNVLLSILFSNIFIYLLSLSETKFHTHTKLHAKLQFCIF